ncbi:MAG: MltA domain-containing protein [Pseudomonadota bacterium]
MLDMRRLTASFCLLAFVLSCAERSLDPPPLAPVALSDIPGLSSAPLLPAVRSFAVTCPNLLRRGTSSRLQGLDWTTPCADAPSVTNEEEAQRFFERHFEAIAIDGGQGLVTGYYEPVFEGSPQPTNVFSAPVLTTPSDLVSVDLGAFRPELRGKRIAGQLQEGRLVPYADRKEIENNPPQSANVLGYMRPDDLFFLQIQGSGVLEMPGQARRIGYASQNGHIYVAIGKTLINEGALVREDVTMQSIRAWLDNASPSEAARVRATNPSYVFFQDRGDAAGPEGPIGSAGVPLSPRVSVAVDRTIVPLGAPVWVAGTDEAFSFEGMTIAQDTGGAIKGAGRVDLFIGRGDAAGDVAGRLKLPARIIVLIPRSHGMTLAEVQG